MHFPVFASQIFTKESGDALINFYPVPSYPKDQTPLSCPFNVIFTVKFLASQILIVWSWEADENSWSEVGFVHIASTEFSCCPFNSNIGNTSGIPRSPMSVFY